MSRSRRILILGEGFSHDSHYGKTMRGIIRYGPDPVVAILDSKRTGESHEGIPLVGTVEDALPFEPTVAVVGVATQGGRFPPAWRDLLKASIEAGLDVESGLHEFLSEDPELTELARAGGVTLRARASSVSSGSSERNSWRPLSTSSPASMLAFRRSRHAGGNRPP